MRLSSGPPSFTVDIHPTSGSIDNAAEILFVAVIFLACVVAMVGQHQFRKSIHNEHSLPSPVRARSTAMAILTSGAVLAIVALGLYCVNSIGQDGPVSGASHSDVEQQIIDSVPGDVESVSIDAERVIFTSGFNRCAGSISITEEGSENLAGIAHITVEPSPGCNNIFIIDAPSR